MKIKLLIELESRDNFDAEKFGEAIEMAVADSLPSVVLDAAGDPAVMFDSFSVEVVA